MKKVTSNSFSDDLIRQLNQSIHHAETLLEPIKNPNSADGQSQRIALADTEQQRATAQQQNFWAFLESGCDLDKVFRAQNFDEPSSGEITARRTNHHIQQYIAESGFAQYRNGLMTDEVEEAKKGINRDL